MDKTTNTTTATGLLSDAESTLKDMLNAEKHMNDGIGKASQQLLQFSREIKSILAPFSQIQNAAIELAKSVGLSSKSIMATAESTIAQNRKMQLSMSYNISSEEMIKMQSDLMSRLQRNVRIDAVGTKTPENPNFDSDLENLIAAEKVFGPESVGQIVAGFDKLGMSMKTAAKATGKLFQEAGEYGINLQKYTENFTSNLQMAQMYNFRNGVNGLKEMARKATEIRQDMKQIASFADKVGSVTGAVETAANLQVLGGSFSALANPLSMLNESLTDMNGLQDRFTQMTAGAAHYNSVTHQIEMDPVTRQLMKRAAESMGVDPANLIDQAYAQARRGEIERQMEGIGNLSAEFKKMAPNVGTIDEYGRAGVTTANGEFKAFSEIATMTADEQEALQKQLIEENRSESEDIKEIAKSVMGIEDMLGGREKQVRNEAARNKILPTSLGDTSIYDNALDYLNNVYAPKVIEGAGRLDSALEGILVPLEMAGKRIGTSIFGIANENTAEGAREETRNVVFSNLGTGETAQGIANVLGDFAASVQKFFSNASDWTNEATNGVLNPTKPWSNGNNQLFAGIEGNSNPIVIPKLDLPDFSQTIQKNFVSSSYNNPNNGQRLIVEPGNNTNRPTFQANSNTMQAGQVSVTTNEASINTQANGNAGQTEPYKFDFSGTLTMNINGDNGRIGTVDVLNWMKNDSGFRREMAKAMAETMAEMKAAGQIENK